MKRRPWPDDELEYLDERYPHDRACDIAEFLGRTVADIYATASKYGMAKAPGFIAKAARRSTRARSEITAEMEAAIRADYFGTPTGVIAAKTGLTVGQVHRFAARNGLRKSLEVVRQMARNNTGPDHPMRAFQFKKGQTPPNKGVKGWQAGGRARDTQFKPGIRPHTWVPVGTYRINGDGYLDLKVTDEGPARRHWKAVHRLVWERANGPVPENHVVAFKSGKPITRAELITLDALECISRGELVWRNHPARKSPELFKLIQLKGALKRVINRRLRDATKEGTTP